MKSLIQNAAILFFAATFILTAEVFAQIDGNPENFCRSGFFPRESKTYQIAKIRGQAKERIYFYGDEREDCPQNKNCRLKSYVVPNDEVIVSRKFGDFACVWFQPEKGSETVGWIQVLNLEFIDTNQNPVRQDWDGKWYFYDNRILISTGNKNGVFTVIGDAVWKGLGDNVHIGEFDYGGKPSGNKLDVGVAMDEDDCKVSMQLVGKYLIVSDNFNCGGANVSFLGVYRRQAKK